MVRYGVYLTELQIERLGKLAEATRSTKAEHMRRAIDRYLDKQEERVDFPAEGDEIRVYHL